MSEKLHIAQAKSFSVDLNKYLIQADKDSQRNDDHADLKRVSLEKDLEELCEKTNSNVVSVGGVLLPISKKLEIHRKLVKVPSTTRNLQNLALAVASRRCVCLEGVVGCGKTALVEYLAEITGHGASDFIKVQLGDQTDSKMLLGSYRCTDVPGEFVWQPGVLTRAVSTGKWLLLEDIDTAALDVASVLSNLMETGTVSVPGYRDVVRAKSGFQLFLTQRLYSSAAGIHRKASGASNILEKHWFSVNIETLTRNELINIVQTLYPQLSTSATRIVDVFLMFSMGMHGVEESNNASETTDEVSTFRTGRLISTRDLFKWCSRSVVDFVVSSPDSALKVFQNAVDIFCCYSPDQGI